MTESSEALTKALAEVLRSSVNRDGGWGYFPGKASRLEPTCWAALALRDVSATAADTALVQAALVRIAAWQRADGLLFDVSAAPANLAFNGLAAVVLRHTLVAKRANEGGHDQAVAKLLSAITRFAGVSQGQNKNLRQDNGLVGWPWVDGTFSWVEPTAWCLLALKKASAQPSQANAARIAEGDRMLADRCCLDGGWNYGNANVLGKELQPYVQTSALALCALQDRRALLEVARSLGWLTANWQREPSAAALSLALMAMRVHRQPTDGPERALHAHLAAAGLPANLATCASTLYALNGTRDGYSALAL